MLVGKRNQFAHRVFGVSRNIEDMHGAAREHRAPGGRTLVGIDRMIVQEFDIFVGITDSGAGAIHVALTTHDESHLGVTQLRGGLHQCVEHRLQIEGRAADRLQHVADGGLLLQRFRKLAGARLHFLEQADVAQRDHCLIGKGLQ